MDIRAMQAARLYQGATAPSPQAAVARHAATAMPERGATGFAEAAGAAMRDFASTLRDAEQTAQAAMVGKADPHALVEALSQSELAVEAAVAVRDKVVEAYQEILRMPV
jgi:flagellar hook-basal body complex protein FliE